MAGSGAIFLRSSVNRLNTTGIEIILHLLCRKALSMMVDSFRSTSAPHANASTSRLDDVNIKDKRKSLSGMPSGSSSNAAKKVMDWFRRKSFGMYKNGHLDCFSSH